MISSGKVSFVGWMYVRGLNTEGLESLWLKTSAAWGWRQERSILQFVNTTVPLKTNNLKELGLLVTKFCCTVFRHGSINRPIFSLKYWVKNKNYEAPYFPVIHLPRSFQFFVPKLPLTCEIFIQGFHCGENGDVVLLNCKAVWIVGTHQRSADQVPQP